MPPRKIAARDANHAEKVAKALDMVKRGGFTWEQIADEVGYADRATAYNAVKRELDRMISEPAADIVKVELARLEDMQSALWDRAIDAGGKYAGKPQDSAVRQILGIMLRRSKLLGLDDFERRSIELAESRHALNESQAQLTFEFMNRVMNQISLTPEQRELLPDIIAGELAAITDGEVGTELAGE